MSVDNPQSSSDKSVSKNPMVYNYTLSTNWLNHGFLKYFLSVNKNQVMVMVFQTATKLCLPGFWGVLHYILFFFVHFFTPRHADWSFRSSTAGGQPAWQAWFGPCKNHQVLSTTKVTQFQSWHYDLRLFAEYIFYLYACIIKYDKLCCLHTCGEVRACISI